MAEICRSRICAVVGNKKSVYVVEIRSQRFPDTKHLAHMHTLSAVLCCVVPVGNSQDVGQFLRNL